MDQGLTDYQIIVVDDDKDFVALLVRIIEAQGYQVRSFIRGKDALRWFDDHTADLLLMDYNLEDMNGRELMDQLHLQNIKVPYIVITGEGDERLAATMVKLGAEDYLTKDDDLIKLLPRVLEQTLERVSRKNKLEQAQKNYKKFENLYRELFNSSADALIIVDKEGTILEANQKVADIFGYSSQELLGASLGILCPKETSSLIPEVLSQVMETAVFHETLGARKDGAVLDIEIKGSQILSDDKPAAMFIIRDISERKWAEEELKLTNQQLRVSEQAVRERERRLRAIFQGSAVGIVLYGPDGKAIESNHFFQRLIGYSNIELRAIPFRDYLHPEDRSSCLSIFNDLNQGKCSHYQIEQRFISRMGLVCWVRVTASVMKSDSGQSDFIIHVIEDISERKQAEESLRRNEKKYRLLFENMLDGFAYHQLMYDQDQRMIDYVCLEVNDAFEKLTGMQRNDLIGKKRSELCDVLTDDTFDWKELCASIALSGEVVRVEKYSEKLNHWFLISAYSPVKGYFATIIEDITYRRQIEEELRDFTSELESSNRELENFTRILTDDLQEQLEDIDATLSSFNDRVGSALDQESKNILFRVTKKARKIQRMLSDVMVCSRLSYHGTPFETVDLGHLVRQILDRYQQSLEAANAIVAQDNLPVIYGDRKQLHQMFEKLLDNAIEYRGDGDLSVEISSRSDESMWEICFRDNGVGIDYDQQPRVFDLFYSVNNPGSAGVGLSAVKKIVERHGGQVRMESYPGKGTALYMSFPK